MKNFFLRIIFIPTLIIYIVVCVIFGIISLFEWLFIGKATQTYKIMNSFISWYDNNIMSPATKNFL